MNTRTLTILLVALLAAVSPLAADIVYLNEGEEHTGKLLGIRRDTVLFDEIGSGQMTFPSASVTNILLSTLRQGDEIHSIASITEPVAAGILASLPSPASYPDADFLTLYRQRRFRINPDGSFELVRREIVQILKEPGLGKADQAAFYMADREAVKLLWGHTYAPDGRVHHLTDDTVSDEGIFSATPEYDRLRKLKFGLKNVDLGGVIDIAWSLTASAPTPLRPMLIDDMYGEREPTLHDELTIEFPEGYPLKKTELNWTGAPLPRFAETADPAARTRTWSWTYRNTKGYIPESDMPPASRLFPRVMVWRDARWDDLAVAFAAALKRAEPSPALLDAFIAESGAASATTDPAEPRHPGATGPLPASCGSALDRAGLVYDRLLRRVRFLAIGCPAVGGIEPVPLDVALTKRYGNSLARVALLHAALGRLGISSRIGFMQAWNGGGIREDVPNAGQAISALLKVEVDGRTLYTACDNDYLPFGLLDVDAQGTTACFLNASGTAFHFETIPEGGAGNRSERDVFVKITDDGTMDVREVRRMHGPSQASLRGLKAAKERERQNFAEQLVKRIHPKARMTGYALSRLDDLTAPVTLTLQYRITDGVVRASDELMAFRNHWVTYNSRSAGLATRTYPLDYYATEESVNSVVFELPDGFRWVPWGRDYHWNCGCLVYESTLEQQRQTLLFTDRFRVFRKTYAPAAEYLHYRGCLQQMAELSKQWLIIERTPVTAPGGLPGPVMPDPQG